MLRNWFLFFSWWLVPVVASFGATVGAEHMADQFGWSHQMGPLAVGTIIAQFCLLLGGTLRFRRSYPESPSRPMALSLHAVLSMACYPLATTFTFQHFNL